ncbi:MAG: MFS transporter [Actinomycetota bacterium]
MRPHSETLWKHRDFLKLWSAQATSNFGAQLASLAYPLAAILTLQATPFQMGMLRATGSAAAVLFGLFAGVVVDRVRRRPLLIITDLGRCILGFSITLAFIFGALRIELLYVIYFLSGALTILSEVAGMAFLPSLVEKEQLVEGNSKLAAMDSAAGIAGPSLSGILVQILTAPVAILVDSVSFVFSAAFIWLIRTPEVEPPPKDEKQSVRTEISEGLRFVYSNPILRPLSEAIALHFLFLLMISTIFTLYAIRELQLEPLLLGIIFSALGVGFLLGALMVKRITERFGIGRTMIGGTLLTAFACVLIPLAGGSLPLMVSILIAAHIFLAFGIQINSVNLMSLRQSITPHQMQGRMNASFRFINVFMMMIGAVVAGALGEWIGLRATIAVGAIGMFLPWLRLLFSPMRSLTKTIE